VLWAASSPAQVVINELSAAASDRLLMRGNGGNIQVGSTIPWQALAFDDARWQTGYGPFGFGGFPDVTIATQLYGEMANRTPSLYLRKRFTVAVEQATSTANLQLIVRYNDGFIAFLNGEEVARRNMGNSGMFAYRDHLAFNPSHTSPLETINLPIANTLLVESENVLAIQAHNRGLRGGWAGNFLIQADLQIAGSAPLVTHNSEWKYFPGHAEPSGGVIDYGRLAQFVREKTAVLWAARFFDDTKWPSGSGPVGLEGDDPPQYLLGTDVHAEAFSDAPSLYTRLAFSVTPDEAASTATLRLTLDYDDAVIVYVNGREVARRNIGVPGLPTAHSDLALSLHDANGDNGVVTGAEEVVQLAPSSSLLLPGHNVLGVQFHRHSLASPDAIARVTLETTGAEARVLAQPEDPVRYFIGNREPVVDDGDEDYSAFEEPPDSENDWIELHNQGSEDVALDNWSLTDNADNPRKWVFPPGTIIPADGYLIVMATGLDTGPSDGADFLHANFKLSAAGEYVGLFDPSAAVADEINPAFPPQHPLYSFARSPADEFAFRTNATPGAANDPHPLSAPPAPPAFSLPGGHYPDPVTVSLTSGKPGAIIRYTLGGEEPSLVIGFTYASPLSLTSNCILRARVFLSDAIPSAAATHTYLIAESAARRALPALCLGGDPALTFYGPNATNGPAHGEGIFAIKGGLYNQDGEWSPAGDPAAFNYPMQIGRFTEKPASLEFLPPAGPALRTDLGVRVAGSAYSRPRFLLNNDPAGIFTVTSFTRKPSLNLYFRNDFGGTRPQVYPFIPDSPVTSFQDLRVRAGKNDIVNPFITDEFMRRTFVGTGQKGSRGIFVNLYLNGVFKGYFNLCERLREGFMQEHHGSSASWDVQQAAVFSSGDPVHWSHTVQYLRTAALTNPTAYQQVHEYLDVDNFIDYLLVNIYGATGDWPFNNWVAARERTPQGRWRFYMWDAEVALAVVESVRDPATYNTITNDLDIGDEAKTTPYNYIAAFYTLLKASPEFRLRFADRAQKQFFHDGPLVRERMESLYFELRDAIQPIIVEVSGQPMNQQMYTNWILSNTRRQTVFSQLFAAGLWPATKAPIFSQHGGTLSPGISITLTNANDGGTIYFTTDGSDPRALGGDIAGQIYSAPINLPTATRVQARVLHPSGEWSPLAEASFVVSVAEPVFLPGGTANWTEHTNWNSGLYPNGPGIKALIAPPTSADRNVDLHAPITVGGIRFPQGASVFRNRVRGQDMGHTLSFQNTNGPALLEVGGTGSGFVEFEVEGGITLASDLELRVDNLVGDAEHGALRLRSGWSGGGGLIKTGPGRASLTGENKSFTGAVTVEQGVLAITGPAAPTQSALVMVRPGGQLRLISGGTPRAYDFGGPLHLEGNGRGDDIPGGSGEGKRGALRYDPSSGGNHALIAVSVHVEGPATIHIEGSDNRMELLGSVSGGHPITKSGGGTLRLSADNPGFTPALILENGGLELAGRLGSPVSLSETSVLRGYGECGGVDGTGSVVLNATILSAAAAQGPRHAFVFRQPGMPNFTNASTSGNGLLRVATTSLATPAIDLYLADSNPTPGTTWRGGFFATPDCGLHHVLAAASVRVFHLDALGEYEFLGTNWALAPAAQVAAVNQIADFGDGPITGHMLEVRLPTSVTYDNWRLFAFPNPDDRDNPAISGPDANPDGDRHVNFLEYAFATNPLLPDEPDYSFTWVHKDDALYPAIKFTRFTEATDLSYALFAADELGGPWIPVAVSTHSVTPHGNGLEMAVFRDLIPFQSNRRFLRVQVSSP
jgi:autotransporter-associated beta strand protein